MPSKYPVCTPEQVCSALVKAGFECVSQKGSHRKYYDGKHTVIVPMHRKDLKKGTLRGILEQADLPIEKFVEYL
ncbi:MAG: type II toxin-antitoxin system HicA family toxin [Lachnospiraceae bacterium]|nr:type II toxin-antitoxin system HicA family toxin [Lachnospiraceae bacterium]